MRTRFVGILLVILSVLVAGCPKPASPPMKIVVSVFPIYDLVRRVAGPDAEVTLLLPPATSERAFEPTLQTAQAAAGAKLGVMVGLDLDTWMEAVLKDASPTARVLKVGDRVPTLSASDGKGAIDPYVWLDPQRARLIVKAIGEDMARADSKHASVFRKRAIDVDASLEALDKELEQRTSSAAWKNRVIVTPYASFGYFAERYKLTATTSPSAPPLDAIGGTPEVDSLEKLLRFDAAQLEKTK